MEHQITEVLELAALIIMLGFSTLLGCKAVLSANKSLNEYMETYQDKTTSVKYTPSEKTYGSYDGTLTREELILASMIQDTNIPGGRTIKLGEDTIVLSTDYKENTKEYKGYALKWIETDSGEVSYPISCDTKYNRYVAGKQYITTSYILGKDGSQYYVSHVKSNSDSYRYYITDELYETLKAGMGAGSSDNLKIKVINYARKVNDYKVEVIYD